MYRAVFSSVFLVYLLSNSVKIIKKKLLNYSHIQFVHRAVGYTPFTTLQHTTLLEASKPIPSISCYSTQVNVAIILSGNIVMCWGTLLRDAGSLTRYVKPHVTFEWSHTKKQWPL